jgi:hypothetical protein
LYKDQRTSQVRALPVCSSERVHAFRAHTANACERACILGQFTCPRFEPPYINAKEQKRLFRLYQRVQYRVRCPHCICCGLCVRCARRACSHDGARIISPSYLLSRPCCR